VALAGLLFELFDLGQALDDHIALQGREMVDEKYTFEVIHLMLDDHRKQAFSV
jgi:hypothetical protein